MKNKGEWQILITLTPDDIESLEGIEEDRKRAEIDTRFRYSLHPKGIIARILDTCIERGIIAPYAYTLRDKCSQALEQLYRMERRRGDRIQKQGYSHDSLTYSDMVKTMEEQPSLINALNAACKEEGIRFREGSNQIEIYRAKDGVSLVDLSGFSDRQLQLFYDTATALINADLEARTPL